MVFKKIFSILRLFSLIRKEIIENRILKKRFLQSLKRTSIYLEIVFQKTISSIEFQYCLLKRQFLFYLVLQSKKFRSRLLKRRFLQCIKKSYFQKA